jgi:hypothetical protein
MTAKKESPVLMANLVLSEREEQEVVFGLSERSYDMAQLWAEIPRGQCPLSDPQSARYMDLVGLHFNQIDEGDAIRIFRLGANASCRRIVSHFE